MRTHDFEQIAAEFQARADQMVWCSMATVGRDGRPRSRVALTQFPEPTVIWTAEPAV